MKRRTLLLAGSALAVALLAGALFGGAPPSAGPGTVPLPPALAESALSGIAQGSTAATVARLETALRADPGNVDRLAALGLGYQLRWRETADPAFISRSGAALGKAHAGRPTDPAVALGLANLALIRHEFRRALVLGREAQRRAPYSARPYGIVGDALIELGRYPAAFAALERMVALRPSLAAYARIGYARELSGATASAIEAMRLALDSAGGQPEPSAWTHVELGKLELGRGRLAAAERHADAALAISPGYVYALEQQARIEAARGDLELAIRHARRAAETIPLPQFLGLLEELLDRRGRPEEARRQRATVTVIHRLLRANGVRIDLEAAVYRADRRIDPQGTVALARRARADRPSIYGDDALGWALARAGRCVEAAPWSRRALRLGTKDALLYFHRGYVAGCTGDRASMRAWYGRALALSPAFSVRWAPVARRATRAPNRSTGDGERAAGSGGEGSAR